MNKHRKYQVGDKVRILPNGTTASSRQKDGHEGVVTDVRFAGWDVKRNRHEFKNLTQGHNVYIMVDGDIDVWPKDLELIEAATGSKPAERAKYILETEDNMETVDSKAELDGRLKELAEENPKRTDLRVYEVARIMEVSFETKVRLGTAEAEELADTGAPAAKKTNSKLGKKRCTGCRRFFQARGLRRHQASCWRYRAS